MARNFETLENTIPFANPNFPSSGIFSCMGNKFIRNKNFKNNKTDSFSKKEGKIAPELGDVWFCEKCTYANSSLLISCAMCREDRSKKSMTEVKWICKICTFINVTVEPHVCSSCQKPMPSPLADN